MSRRSVGHGLMFATLSFVVAASLAVVSSIVMARVYGIDVVGESALAAAPMGMLGLLSTVSEQPAFIRTIAPLEPRSRSISGLFAAVCTFSTTLTVVVAAIVAAVAYVLFEGPLDHPGLVGPALAYMAGYV